MTTWLTVFVLVITFKIVDDHITDPAVEIFKSQPKAIRFLEKRKGSSNTAFHIKCRVGVHLPTCTIIRMKQKKVWQDDKEILFND